MIEITKLIWNEWNVFHINRHCVMPQEVYESCHSQLKVLKTYKGRILVIGKTKTNRLITTVLSPEGNNVYFVVTARDTNRKERRMLK